MNQALGLVYSATTWDKNTTSFAELMASWSKVCSHSNHSIRWFVSKNSDRNYT